MNTQPTTKPNRYVMAVLYALAVGSGCFLFARYVFSINIETGLVVGAFFGAAVGTYFAQRPE
jgi:hypothetical protein